MADLNGEAWHQEQRRKSLDMVRVYNPTDEDFNFVYDGYRQMVPNKNKDIGYGKGMRVLQRFVAEYYTKHIVDKMIIEKSDTKLKEVKDAMEKRGAADIEFNANQQVMNQYRVDDIQLREPLEDQVLLGTEEEYGLNDLAETVEPKKEFNADPMERLRNKKYVSPIETPTMVNTEVGEPKKIGRPAIKHDLSEVSQ